MTSIFFTAMTKAELDALFVGWQRALPKPVTRKLVNPFTKKEYVGKTHYPKELRLDAKAQLKILRQNGDQHRKLKPPSFEMPFIGTEDLESLLDIAAGKKLPELRPVRQLGDSSLYALPQEAKPVLADLWYGPAGRCAVKISEAVKPLGSHWPPEMWAQVLADLRRMAKDARPTRRTLYYESVF
jgi:hypothetical protein